MEDSKQKKEPVDYQFHPDSGIKKFLAEISSPQLIDIINGILDKTQGDAIC